MVGLLTGFPLDLKDIRSSSVNENRFANNKTDYNVHLISFIFLWIKKLQNKWQYIYWEIEYSSLKPSANAALNFYPLILSCWINWDAMPTSNFQPIRLLDMDCCYKFTYLMANCADPDQLASEEANWFGLHCLQWLYLGSAGPEFSGERSIQKCAVFTSENNIAI